jgi:hypothetical protein
MPGLLAKRPRLLISCLASLWLVACGAAPAPGGTASAPPAPAVTAGATAPATTPSLPAPTATATPPSPAAACPPGSGEAVSLSLDAEGQTPVEILAPQIVAFLNVQGGAQGLQAALDRLSVDDGGTTWQAASVVHSADVTGDAAPEVVLGLFFYVEGQFADGALLVFRCQAGEYVGGVVTRVGSQLFAGQGPEALVRTIQDMNRNGRPEIVVSYVPVIGTHANYTREFRILEWDGSRFADRIHSEGDRPHVAQVLNGDGTVHDVDGDGYLELALTHGPGRGPDAVGPDCPGTDVWAWNGEAYVLSRTEPCPGSGRRMITTVAGS